MSELLMYIKNGINRSILVGQPDFTINNQYTDIENISNDFQYSRSMVIDEYKKQRCKKTKSSIKRK
jgi:hypothetical protein